MNPQDLQSEELESSSSEEADDEEEDQGEEKSASESSIDDDEFDSDDDRVNLVPGAIPPGGQESSEESDSEGNEEEVPAMKPADSETTRPIKRFDSDVESEYDTDSSSESEGLTQKSTEWESSVEALALTQKKAKEDDVSVNHTGATNAHAAKKGKERAGKQQQLDPKLAKPNEKDHPPAKKGHGGAAKILPKEQSRSRKDEQKGAHLATKRKLEQSGHDGETDSAGSVPISKRRKDVDSAPNGKVGADRNRAEVILSDSGKEIARKTLSDPSVYEKKANAELNKGPQAAQKPKKLPHIWSTNEEIIVASEVLNRVKMGLEVPKRNDDFWLTLSEVLIEKVGVEFSRDQLCEKVKRMKPRYEGVVQKFKESQESQKPFKFKTNNEQSLFDIWSQIWGKAEVTSLDDHKEPSKQVVAALEAKEGKNPPKVSKSRPASKAKVSKDNGVATAGDGTGKDALQVDNIVSMPMELGKGEEAAKEDHVQDGLEEPDVVSKDVRRVLEGKISTTLHDLQVWSKSSIEVWMNKALALIDTAVREVGDQARHMNAMGTAGDTLHMRLCDCVESQSVHGEPAFQQQWYELHLQELNVYAQRLDLLRKECEIKQERVKRLLQGDRGK